ncbi:response regulator [Sphingomonas sp. LY54]|uniref:response regulator n=1 Tax=Sphingomonas sp. LY54 TaxID=3095343 RepID=UPI002D78DD15|nr:response regulator [Sphingomonas sp. LY54]WRP28395.1 response regulator [Sphingomonas sp. LY54]
MHALIIEDEVYTAEMLRFALSGMGFRSFDVAVSEKEARAAVAARRPDLICADVTLNPGDGIRVVKSILAGTGIPVFFVTAAPQRVETAIPDAIVVPKPFSLKQVYLASERALERGKKPFP